MKLAQETVTVADPIIAAPIPMFTALLVLLVVLRRTPAVAAVPRRRALVTWAVVLTLVGGPLVVLGAGTETGDVAIVGILSAALAVTLLGFELVVTALTPTEGGRAASPPG